MRGLLLIAPSFLTACSLIVQNDNTYDRVDASARDAGRERDAGSRTDAGQDAGPPLEAPELRFPWNGFMTGSALSGALDPPRNALRPRFIWEPVDGADSYEVGVAIGCDVTERDACDFTAAAIEQSMTSEWRPSSSLEVSMDPPMGRRYFWRVRACRAGVCFAWSETRFVEVGRLVSDLDGDGLGDIALLERNVSTGTIALLVYFGPNFSRFQTLPNVAPQCSGEGCLAYAGDVNGDGFADLVSLRAPNGARVTFGGVTLRSDSSGDIPRPTGANFNYVAGGGDLNADGFSDLAFGSPSIDEDRGRVDVFLGGEVIGVAPVAMLAGPMPMVNLRFGRRSSLAGDFDGDGYCDLAIAAPGLATVTPDVGAAGALYVFTGSASGVAAAPTLTFVSPNPTLNGSFGLASIAGNANGDAFADGAVLASGESAGAGALYAFVGAVSSPNEPNNDFDVAGLCTPCPNLANTRSTLTRASIAQSLDVDGDGFDDLIVGTPMPSSTDSGSGAAMFLRGSSGGYVTAPASVMEIEQSAGPDFGVSTTATDLDGDGLAEVIIAAPRLGLPVGAGPAGRFFVYSYRSGVLEMVNEFVAPSGLEEFASALASVM
jgi:hypothetical protein